MSLNSLGLKYKTDKATSKHSYTLIYDKLFSPIRHTVTSVLEFGVYRGASLKMWEKYFPNARITGVDIRKPVRNTGRVSCYKFDCRNYRKLAGEPFDIIIDDASHFCSAQQKSLDKWIHTVKHGGFYIVEDLHTSGMKKYLDTNPSTRDLFKEWVSSCPFPGWTCTLECRDKLGILHRTALQESE